MLKRKDGKPTEAHPWNKSRRAARVRKGLPVHSSTESLNQEEGDTVSPEDATTVEKETENIMTREGDVSYTVELVEGRRVDYAEKKLLSATLEQGVRDALGSIDYIPKFATDCPKMDGINWILGEGKYCNDTEDRILPLCPIS